MVQNSSRPAASRRDIDEQLWPIDVAILLLAAFAVGVVVAHSSFFDARLLYNGWARLLGIALITAPLFVAVRWLDRLIVRRTQFCLLVALLVHLCLFEGMRLLSPPRTAIDQVAVKSELDSVPEVDVAEPPQTAIRAEYDVPVELPNVNQIVPAPEKKPEKGPEGEEPRRLEPNASAVKLGEKEGDPPAAQPDATTQLARAEISVPRRAVHMPPAPAPRAAAKPPTAGDDAIPAPTIKGGGDDRPAPRPSEIAAAEVKRMAGVPTAAATAADGSRIAETFGAEVALGRAPGQDLAVPLPDRRTNEPGDPQLAATTPLRAPRGFELPSAAAMANFDAKSPAAGGGSLASRIDATSALAAVTRTTGPGAPPAPQISAAGTAELAIGTTQTIARAGVPRIRNTGEPSGDIAAAVASPRRSPRGAEGGALPTPEMATVPMAAAGREGTGLSLMPTSPAGLTTPARGSRAALPAAAAPIPGETMSFAATGGGGPPGIAPRSLGALSAPSPADLAGGASPALQRSVWQHNPSPQTVLASAVDARHTAPGGARRDGSPLDAAVAGYDRQVAGPLGSGRVTALSGSPSSMASAGPALIESVARRGVAGQPGGKGFSDAPSVASTLVRNASGGALPALAVTAEDPSQPGAGGVGDQPGAAPSTLPPGPGSAGGAKPSGAEVASAGPTRYRPTLPDGSAVRGMGAGTADQPLVAPTAAIVGTESTGRAAVAASKGSPVADVARSGATAMSRAPSTITVPVGVDEPLPGTGSTRGTGKSGKGGRRGDDQVAGADVGGVELAMATEVAQPLRGTGGVLPGVAGEGAIASDADPGLPGLVGPRTIEPGVTSRRARPESTALHAEPRRFLIARSGNSLAVAGTIREPAEPFQHRDIASRIRKARERGGSEVTERAVEAGLDAFARLQFPDGHWSLNRVPDGVEGPDAALGQMESDSAATGLALLSYLGAGYTHLEDKHRETVHRGIEWLVKNQKQNGDLFKPGSKYTWFYSHGIAAMALCEAYGMTQDPELREPARKAADFIIRSQEPRRGGWRYEPAHESDTSVSGWQLQALKSGQMAGLDLPQEPFRLVDRWLDQAQLAGGKYIYNPYADKRKAEQAEGLRPSLAMTGEAMLMRMYLGRPRNDPALVAGAKWLQASPPQLGTAERPHRDSYYWYYGTLAMYQMREPYWSAWNERLKDVVLSTQEREGPWAGTWHPTTPVRDRWGHAGGRMYVTAMHLMMLEVYYRVLPLYRELEN